MEETIQEMDAAERIDWAERDRIEAEAAWWTPDRVSAASLVAGDKLSRREIADELGINVRTLFLWLQIPAFRRRVTQIRETLKRQIEEFALARQVDRIACKNRRWLALNQIPEDRQAQFAQILETGIDTLNPEASVAIEPGMDSGFMAKEVLTVGGRSVVRFVSDIGLSRELSDLENDVAKELGQISTKIEMTGASGGPMRICDEPDLAHLSPEELDAYEKLLEKATGSG